MIHLMKAHQLVDETLLDSGDWVAEEKLDGQRLELNCNGNGMLFAWSRLGNDIIKAHPWLKEIKLQPGSSLDCELYVPNGSSNKTLEDRAIERLAVFDVAFWMGRDCMPFTYVWRREKCDDIVRGLRHDRVAMTRSVYERKREFYDEIVAVGGEGVMLKKYDGEYVQCPGSRRSWLWQKKKKWLTVEVLIVGCLGQPTLWTVKPGHVGTDGQLYPQGKPSTTALKGYKNLEYGYWSPAGLVKVGTLGVTGTVDELLPWLYKVVEVKCAGVYSGTGALRHPGLAREGWASVRDDKKMEDVTLQSIIEAGGKHVIKTNGKKR